MSMQGSSFSTRKDTSAENLLKLYQKIPDYSELRHLAQSEFNKTLEELKEEFRLAQESLYRAEIEEDEDFLVNRIEKSLTINDLIKSKSQGNDETCPNLQIQGYSSQLHRPPTASNSVNYLNYNRPSRSLSFNFDKKSNEFQDYLNSDEDEEIISTLNSDSWSSNPELQAWKEYVPPANVEKRILERKSFNHSAPSLSGAPASEDGKMFKANPVPSHVYKPLYDFIMLKNEHRSQKVREQSKQKLLAQVKPFSFSKREAKSGRGNFFNKTLNNELRAPSYYQAPSKEVLNNTRPIKGRGSHHLCSRAHTHNNNIRMVNHFKANPAPPRSKALLSAMRLKEQQEYRELKKRLRSEALLKNAALPPAMAARDKRLKICNAKLDSILQEYQNSCNSAKDKVNRGAREQSTDGEVDDGALTDEDRVSEDSFRYLNSPATTSANTLTKKRKNFTPYGKSRHSSAASGIFECTSNDNLASRLRIQATRKREEERIKCEEEELLKLMKNENRRKRLKDSHISAWRRAHSYSSNQDIAMRRQLRMAASILERESFVRDMSSMLTRVRSAPLLLEGVRERRYEPCKKHREEFLHLSDRSLSNNKVNTARFATRKKTSARNSNWFLNQYDDDGSRSECNAMAEGSLTNSENESESDTSENERDNIDGNKGEIKTKGDVKMKKIRIAVDDKEKNNESGEEIVVVDNQGNVNLNEGSMAFDGNQSN